MHSPFASGKALNHEMPQKDFDDLRE